MTLAEVRAIVGARIRDTSTSTNSRIDEAANDAADAILQRVGLPKMSDFIRTETGRSVYSLRPTVGQITDNMTAKEDQQSIFPATSQDYDTYLPKPTSTGVPAFYRVHDSRRGVYKNPESIVRLISTSDSDTQDVTVYGISGGRQKSETITLSGDSSTAVIGTTTFSELTDAPSASSAAVGTITATMNSTSAQVTYPTVADAGNVTVFTIAVGNTAPTNLHNPGSLIRISMASDVDSGNPANDQGKDIVIEGYTVNTVLNYDRVFRREVVTTNGTNPQTTPAASSQQFTEVTNVTKEWGSTNTLWVRADPSTTLIAAIPPEQRSISLPWVQFYPEPTGGKSIWYNYYPRWVRLSNDGDQPYFESIFDQVWIKWTERISRAFKRNESYAISVDPEFQLDVDIIMDKQGERVQPNLAMGTGLSPRRRGLTYGGRLDPSRFSNSR